MTKDPGIGTDTPAELDLSGLKCPLPALRVRRALRRLAPGARLAVFCTDPLSGVDVPNAARQEGAVVESCERHDAAFRFLLRREPSGISPD